MDTRRYGAGPIKPDDVRDGPRVEKIINVYESEKYKNLVLELESGDTFNLYATNTRVLNKAWGFESDNWLGQELKLSLGTYKNWKNDPPTDDETVVVEAISPRKPVAQNGGAAVPVPSKTIVPGGPVSLRNEMDDDIPFLCEWR